ncbi:MAG: hypothetical protein ACREP0_01910 [Rhodanobacteraceae bacterium]
MCIPSIYLFDRESNVVELKGPAVPGTGSVPRPEAAVEEIQACPA